MEIRFNAPQATQEQCSKGAEAAHEVLQASGLSALAARNAFAEVVGAATGQREAGLPPSPATVRAARAWNAAFDAAMRACYGSVVHPFLAHLEIAGEGSP